MTETSAHIDLFAGHGALFARGESLSSPEARTEYEQWCQRRHEFVAATVRRALMENPGLKYLSADWREFRANTPVSELRTKLEIHETARASAAIDLDVPVTTPIEEIVARRANLESERMRLSNCREPLEKLSEPAGNVLAVITETSSLRPREGMSLLRAQRPVVTTWLSKLNDADPTLASKLKSAFSSIFDQAQEMRTPLSRWGVRLAFGRILKTRIGPDDASSQTVHEILVSLKSEMLLKTLIDEQVECGREEIDATDFINRAKLVREYGAALDASVAALRQLADDDPERMKEYFGKRPSDPAKLEVWLDRSDPRCKVEYEYTDVHLDDGSQTSRELRAILARSQRVPVIGLPER